MSNFWQNNRDTFILVFIASNLIALALLIIALESPKSVNANFVGFTLIAFIVSLISGFGAIKAGNEK